MHERVHLCQEHAIQGLSADTEIREVGSGLSLADTQTAAMGGFALDDGYLRGVATDAQRFTGSLLDLLLVDVSKHSSRTQLFLQLSLWYRYRYRCAV
jgi:hypothetical protein